MSADGELDDGDFSRSRWSLLRMPDGANSTVALAELAVRYWYPVYAYLRRSGNAPAVAQDIAHAFFAHLPIQFFAAPDAVRRSDFCAWLRASLQGFQAGRWHELVSGMPVAGAPDAAQLERRYRSEARADDSAESAFLRGFASEALQRGLHGLCREACQAGHGDLFHALRPFLASDPPPALVMALYARFGVRPATLALALQCLRRRFHELVAGELADTVGSQEELDAARQGLFEVVRAGA